MSPLSALRRLGFGFSNLEVFELQTSDRANVLGIRGQQGQLVFQPGRGN